MTIAPGTTLGRYRILEPLGQGGMAFVYKAFQPALDRTVALKVIRWGFAEDPEFRDRFEREAKAIARLRHPNIVDVFDYDEIAGQVFLAMQYVEGGTLKDRLARLAEGGGRMPQEETAAIVRQVAAALEYAHRRSVIHRDIKPSNVMLGEDGSAIVTDFGIAKIVGGTQHTATGVGIGTPEYMSPEQGQGLPLDGRTDQYALAVMAYEMLTGQLPYTADTPFAVVLKHVRDPVPRPSTLDTDIARRTEQVLLRGLAKDPADRYATVNEFATDLERSIDERPGRTLPTVVTRAPSSPTERVAGAASVRSRALIGRPIVLAAAGIGLLLLAGGGAAVLGAFTTSTPIPSASSNLAAATTAAPLSAPPTAAPVTTAPVTNPPAPLTTAPATTPPPPPPVSAIPAGATAAPSIPATLSTPVPWTLSAAITGGGSVRVDYDRPFRAIGSDWMSPTESPIDSLRGRHGAAIPSGARTEAWIRGGEPADRVVVSWPAGYSCTGQYPRLKPLTGPGPFFLGTDTIICMLAAPRGPGPHALGLRFESASLAMKLEGGPSRVRISSAGSALVDDFDATFADDPVAVSGAITRIPIDRPLRVLAAWFLGERVRTTISWTGGSVSCGSRFEGGSDLTAQPYVTDGVLYCDLPPAMSASQYTLNIRWELVPTATLTPKR